MASTSTRYLSISKRTFVSSLLLGFACAFGLNYMNALRVLLTLIFFFRGKGKQERLVHLLHESPTVSLLSISQQVTFGTSDFTCSFT